MKVKVDLTIKQIPPQIADVAAVATKKPSDVASCYLMRVRAEYHHDTAAAGASMPSAAETPIDPHKRPLSKSILDEWTRRR